MGADTLGRNRQWDKLAPPAHPEKVIDMLRSSQDKLSSWYVKDNLVASLLFWYPNDWEKRLEERIQAGRRPAGRDLALRARVKLDAA